MTNNTNSLLSSVSVGLLEIFRYGRHSDQGANHLFTAVKHCSAIIRFQEKEFKGWNKGHQFNIINIGYQCKKGYPGYPADTLLVAGKFP